MDTDDFFNERMVVNKSNRYVEEEHLARYRFVQPFANNKKILDIACGSGYGSSLLGMNGGNIVFGGDISSDAILYAKKQYAAPGKNVVYSIMDTMNLSIRDSSIDLIVCFETIEHLDQPEKALDEFTRVLKNKGVLIISTPNKYLSDFPSGWLRPFKNLPSNKFHKKEYTLVEFSKLLSKRFKIDFVGGQRFLFIHELIVLALGCHFYPRKILQKYLDLISQSPSVVTSNKFLKIPAFFVLICSKKIGDNANRA